MPNWDNHFFEPINGIDVKIRKDDSIYFTYSYSKNTSLISGITRRSQSLLWHLKIKDFPILDSILLDAIRNNKLSPEFYAACLERHGIDYALGMGSGINWEYKFDLKKIINDSRSKQINKLRTEIGIRTLEEDLALFKAIQQLENLKYHHYFKRKTKGSSLFFNSLFTSKVP